MHIRSVIKEILALWGKYEKYKIPKKKRKEGRKRKQKATSALPLVIFLLFCSHLASGLHFGFPFLGPFLVRTHPWRDTAAPAQQCMGPSRPGPPTPAVGFGRLPFPPILRAVCLWSWRGAEPRPSAPQPLPWPPWARCLGSCSGVLGGRPGSFCARPFCTPRWEASSSSPHHPPFLTPVPV